MSKKANKPEEVTEAVVEETVTEEAVAEEAPAEEAAPAETTETATEETAVTEEAAPKAETADAPEDTAEEEACAADSCGKPFRFVSTIVNKIKEKTTKPEACLPAECDTDADGDLDEIILDDDIIAELQEYERREKMKKKIALCAAGALAAGILIGIAIKSKKNRNG